MAECKRTQVLVVDDDLMQLEYYMAVLEGDYEVITATCFAEAIEILAAGESVDLLACDMHLGWGQNGNDLLAWVETHRPELMGHSFIISGDPVVDVTASSVPVVMKPVEPSCLLEVLQQLQHIPSAATG